MLLLASNLANFSSKYHFFVNDSAVGKQKFGLKIKGGVKKNTGYGFVYRFKGIVNSYQWRGKIIISNRRVEGGGGVDPGCNRIFDLLYTVPGIQ